MAEATEKEDGGPKRKAGSIFLWVLAAGILFAFYESIVLLLIGMFPTGIALLLDRSPQKDQARAIGYLNFAGCVPWVVDFWMGDGGFEKVFDIVGDPIILAIMYTAAGVGWGLCFVVRPFVGTYLRMSADFRESQIRKRQEALIEVWGEEVTEAIDEESGTGDD
jgi:hypothetical protein